MGISIQLFETEVGLDRRLEPPGSKYAVQFTRAGNLELWNSESRRLLWESGTAGQGAAKLAMQTDGNLVIYNWEGEPLWSSGTSGCSGARLTIQDDGNLVVYAPDHTPLWNTGTVGAS